MDNAIKPHAYIVLGKIETNKKEPTVSKERLAQIEASVGKYLRGSYKERG